ncbi:unnamed protein product [Pseudo-nitzschia multistriata]|uniref:RING-type domain-containing protein n=1 Tax=Pseudo-nitzschia multistriata TaxID=183589 RepID=A0A448ZFC7_9STRA|nr:unnamed protein product [Pseudo-nitzschia multistriata]
MASDNWCGVCQEACTDHPTICSVCGATLEARPLQADRQGQAPAHPADPDPVLAALQGNVPEHLILEMQAASRDLRNILGNLRGQVQNLDVLTRDILEERDERGNLPREFWDPQHGADRAGASSRPTSKEALARIPRFVLNDRSTMFRQATLRVAAGVPAPGSGTCCLLSTTAPVHPDAIRPSASSVTSATGRTNATAAKENLRKFDCVLGEFGPAGEHSFEMGKTPLVAASPVTGKGGLDEATKARISGLGGSGTNKVVVYMQRGDGLTYVQKARMAQDAGASAVIIGNNTPTPWPYVMKDLAGESTKPGRSICIPVAMVKEEDGREIIRLLEAAQTKTAGLQKPSMPQPPIPKQILVSAQHPAGPATPEEPKPPQPDEHEHEHEQNDHQLPQPQPQHHLLYGLSCDLAITEQSCDCPVCCEQLAHGETVVQLPGCGHVFHEACALHWLESHNTCPYCRRELPTDDPEYERERRLRQQQQQRGTGDAAAGHGGASFYG